MSSEFNPDQVLRRLSASFAADLWDKGWTVEEELIQQFSQRIFLVGYMVGYENNQQLGQNPDPLPRPILASRRLDD